MNINVPDAEVIAAVEADALQRLRSHHSTFREHIGRLIGGLLEEHITADTLRPIVTAAIARYAKEVAEDVVRESVTRMVKRVVTEMKPQIALELDRPR